MSTAIYLDRSGAAQALDLSESTLEKLVREDDSFPKPRRTLSSGATAGFMAGVRLERCVMPAARKYFDLGLDSILISG